MPVTGTISELGPPCRDGADVAVQEINDAGGLLGNDVEVQHEDSESVPDAGVRSANRLMEEANVPAMVGPLSSGVGMSIAPIAAENGVTYFPGGSSPAFTELDQTDWIFRTRPSDAFVGSALGFIRESGVTERIEEIYRVFPALERNDGEKAAALSGGQRQMLAMGRALMLDPELLLIDEPSAGLAPELVDTAFDNIETVRDRGTAVLMVEQNATKALERSDRGYVLDQGQDRFEGTGEDLLDNEEVAKLYLGAA